jgi:hypothetical protein
MVKEAADEARLFPYQKGRALWSERISLVCVFGQQPKGYKGVHDCAHTARRSPVFGAHFSNCLRPAIEQVKDAVLDCGA